MLPARFRYLSLLVGASALALACGGAGEDEEEGQGAAITDGHGDVESSTVYLFETKDAKLPRCIGALLSPTIAVTARPCAKVGMLVGRAHEGDGKKGQTTAKAVHVPGGADPDIAVIELEKALPGSHALITHAPLKKGYKVNGVATDDLWWFQPGPDHGEVSSLEGELVSETEMHSALVPESGKKLCLNDIGASVCSSTAAGAWSLEIRGTCGLAGIVVAPPELPAQTAGGATPSALDKDGCSPGAWKVAQLGRHAEFLRKFAPKAFQPMVSDKIIVSNFPYVPDGLWGYKTNGEVASCKIETPKLDPTVVNTDVKVAGKASFKNMGENAAAYGRVGIAPRTAPGNVRWMPAKIDKKGGSDKAFDATFEGVVRADRDGDYIVMFRASANGGETWTVCDSDPADAKFEPEKSPPLKVGVVPPSEPTTTGGDAGVEGGTPASGAVPEGTPTSPSTSSSFSDESSEDDSSGDDKSKDDGPAEALPKKKKKAAASGCSAALGTGTGAGTGAVAPLLGVALGLAALRRRRPRA